MPLRTAPFPSLSTVFCQELLTQRIRPKVEKLDENLTESGDPDGRWRNDGKWRFPVKKPREEGGNVENITER